MARIIWTKKYAQMTTLLHSGVSVADTAKELSIGYATLCKELSALSLDKHGHFKKPIKSTPQLEDFFKNFVLKENQQISQICEDYGATPAQVQNLMRTYALTKEWDLAHSSSENVAIGRTGELFLKEQPEFKVVADMIKKDSKAPYDIVLVGYGAVDAKVTKLRETPSGGHRHKFNVANVTKPTRYAFCIGYTSDHKEPMILFKIPYKFLKGKQTLSVSVEKLEGSKYEQFIHKIYPSSETHLYSETLRAKYLGAETLQDSAETR